MATKRLGRGLGALLGQPGAATGAATSAAALPAQADNVATLTRDEELITVPVDLLQRGKYQPRVDMRQETLQELAESIKAQGVVQPIVIRPLEGAAGQPRRYEIIAGERRWRAAQLAGLHEIPAVVRRVPDEAAVAMALIENIQRENLNPLEEARALERLIAEFGVTHEQAAEAVGRSRAAVSNLLRLLDLAPEVAEMVEKRRLDMGHARALLGIPSRREQVMAAQKVVAEGLSVRETEALVRQLTAPPAEKAKPAAASQHRDPDVQALERDLTERLGAKVLIHQGSGGKGRLLISYNSLDELDGILAQIRRQ